MSPKSYTGLALALLAASIVSRAQVLTSPNTVGSRANTEASASGHTKIRATAVVEFAGEKPVSGAYRLVPIAIYKDGRFHDAQLYVAQPTPAALDKGTIYEIQDSGKAIGYATVGRSGYKRLIDSDYNEWYGMGYFDQTAPDAELKSKAPSKIVFDDSKESHRVYMPEDKKRRGQRGKRPQDTKTDKDGKSAPNDKPDATAEKRPDDPDHPTLKKRAPEVAAIKQPEMPTEAVETDPNRPKLTRGKPASGAVPLPEDVEFNDPNVKVMPAVSDPNNKEPRQFHYDFNGQDEQKYRAKMLALAVSEAKRAFPSFTASPAQLQDVNLRAFDLTVDNVATLVLTATAPDPIRPKYLTLVARVNLEAELDRTFFQLTDKDRFDIAPRMQLVDAVDADGDGRGELLFRLQSDQGTGWGLYRATADGIKKLFDDLPPGA